MNRREALGVMAALPWLNLHSRRRLDRIGLAMITIGRVSARDYEAALHQVAAIGYRELDMYIYESRRTPKETRAMIDRAGLTCPSARVRTPALYRGLDRYLDAANILGARWLTLADVPSEERLQLLDWRELADVMNRAGEAARKHGLGFVYHNHSYELEPQEGTVPLDLLLASTDPTLVKLQMDVYWMTHGSRDPATEIRRLGSRVASLHLKDMDRTPERGITTVGRGKIDFAPILAAATDAGVANYFVEEDAPADPMEAIRASYSHLARLEF